MPKAVPEFSVCPFLGSSNIVEGQARIAAMRMFTIPCRFWYIRHVIFRILMTTAMWILPTSRYKRELSAAHWTLGLKVIAEYAATEAARTGATDLADPLPMAPRNRRVEFLEGVLQGCLVFPLPIAALLIWYGQPEVAAAMAALFVIALATSLHRSPKTGNRRNTVNGAR